jgi:hypothetical protein
MTLSPEQLELLAQMAAAPVRPHGKLRRDPVPHGHVMPPGTGPAGETCGSCKHLTRKHMGKVYLKCGLNHRRWTGGKGSDVRAKDAACKRWEAK